MSNPFQTITVAPDVAAALQVKQLGNATYANLVRTFNAAHALVWNNPNATPEAVVAALGTDAVKIFTASSGLATYLNSLGASPALPTTLPSGYAFAGNPDGSGALTKNS